MSYKSIDMEGKNLGDAQAFLRKATAEIQSGSTDIESIKAKLKLAQESLKNDSGKASQDLSKNVNNTIKDLAAILSSGGNMRQKLKDVASDVNKMDKKIDKEKDTRRSFDSKTSLAINALAGKMSAYTKDLKISGRKQSGTSETNTGFKYGIDKNMLIASGDGVPSGKSTKDGGTVDKISQQEAIDSIHVFGKWIYNQNNKFMGQTVKTEYGGEQDSKTRANYARSMYKNLDGSKFTSAGSFSMAGETSMYAVYNAMKKRNSITNGTISRR